MERSRSPPLPAIGWPPRSRAYPALAPIGQGGFFRGCIARSDWPRHRPQLGLAKIVPCSLIRLAEPSSAAMPLSLSIRGRLMSLQFAPLPNLSLKHLL